MKALTKGDGITLSQYSLHYQFSAAADKCTTLVYTGVFAELPLFGEYGKAHFTPLWYPDGDYIVKIQHSDCWTPAGMLLASSVTNSIAISGSAYDDHYVGH